MNNDHVEPYDIIREPSPMISDSGETSSERGERGSMKALAAAATTTSNERSPSQKAVIINEDDADIYIPTQNSNGSGSGHGNRVPAATVNGRSPRLQGQTGALLNRADPLSLSNSGPTTALNIMRRSGGRSNSDTTSGSGGASNQDGGVPRSVVTSTVSPPSSATPVISNVDRRGGNHGERNSNSGMPPTTAMDYRPSQIYGM
eukprot:scaffold16104_cov78-Skeletonema_dohrnii-CCMP3373.AAC.1